MNWNFIRLNYTNFDNLKLETWSAWNKHTFEKYDYLYDFGFSIGKGLIWHRLVSKSENIIWMHICEQYPVVIIYSTKYSKITSDIINKHINNNKHKWTMKEDIVII